MKEYLPRIADDILKHKLNSKGAVVIQGPKWCGKSTTALRQSKSAVYMQDPSTRQHNKFLAEAEPSKFLAGETPKLIDEWQIIPFIWDAVRYEIDKRDEFGQFILTGSATPVNMDKNAHSGTGRITKMTMRPMSLFESMDSTGTVSLSYLFENPDKIAEICEPDLYRIAYFLCRGGWPKAIGQTEQVALQQAIDYYDSLIESDISNVDGTKRDSKKANALLRSYSRHLATSASINTIEQDLKAIDTISMSNTTINSYIKAFTDLFVIEDLKAWSPNLRSKTAIRTADTRHFIDPSIATSALGIGPNDLMNDSKTFGLFFESMCIRDLRVYAEKLGGQVYHYRDKNKLEIDAVVHLRNGEYGLIEIKLSSDTLINEGAENLIKLSNLVDNSKMKKPAFLMVLTGTKMAYKRPDGVFVVPITCLRD